MQARTCIPACWRELCCAAVVMLLWMSAVDAQAQTDGWAIHTSLRETTDLDVSATDLWAATTGGLYRYDPTGEVQRFTSVQGLHGVRVQALAYDAACDCVWLGYRDGVLDRLAAETGTVRTFRDISRANRFPSQAINRLVTYDDSLLIATEFGLVVFDPVREEVRDSYGQFGTLPAATPVRDVAVAPVPEGGLGLWVATAEGIAHAPFAAVNLKDPAAWTVETAGLPSPDTRAVAFFQGRLYVGTGNGLAVREADGTYSLVAGTSGRIQDLFPTPDGLLATATNGMVRVDAAGTARRFVSGEVARPVGVVQGPAGGIWLGDEVEGLVEVALPQAQGGDLQVLQRFYPEGPYHSIFREVEVDAAGNLWASGPRGGGPDTGFYRRSPAGIWTDFIGRFVPQLQGRSRFSTIHVDGIGGAWAGSEGRALAHVTPADEVQVFDQNNSSLRSAVTAGDENFIIISGIDSDSEGRLWTISLNAPEPLNVRLSDGSWEGLQVETCNGLSDAGFSYADLFIDSFDQIWMSVVRRTNINERTGLVVLDTRRTPLDPSDDVCQYWDTRGGNGQGLPSTEVWAVTEDQDGRIWVGTERGLAFMVNTGIVAQDPGATFIWPQYDDRSRGRYLFEGVKVNDITVDPANRLWISTDEGVWLVQAAAEGYEEVLHFTEANSPLLNDEVFSTVVDVRTGRVFFSTGGGLVSYQGDAVAPAEAKQALRVYPNPVRFSDGRTPTVFIEGLVAATEVMILSASGEVVDRFAARGGRAGWDGRDRNGRLVPSGAYLIVAVGQNGEGAAYGKVAVVR